jgi:hypothetical protein
MIPESRNPVPLAADRAPKAFCLATERRENSPLPLKHQASFDAVGPTPEAVAEIEEFLLDEIFHDLCLIASYTTSALEAARRGDREELRLRLRIQLRDCFRHAVELHNLLPPGGKVDAAEAGRAAA